MSSDQELSKTLLSMRFIWFFLFLSPLFYLAVGLYLEPTLKVNLDKKTLETVKMVLYIIAFVTLVGTGYVRNLMLSRPGNPQNQNQLVKDPMLQRYFTAMIVALALSESIGIYGLVLFFLGKDQTDLYLLTLVSAAAMLFYFPKKEHLLLLARHSS
jgi:ATP synthase subunit C